METREKNKETIEIIVSLRKLLLCVPLFWLSSLGKSYQNVSM